MVSDGTLCQPRILYVLVHKKQEPLGCTANFLSIRKYGCRRSRSCIILIGRTSGGMLTISARGLLWGGYRAR